MYNHLAFRIFLPSTACVLGEPTEWNDPWTPVWIWGLTRFVLDSRGGGLGQCMHENSETVLGGRSCSCGGGKEDGGRGKGGEDERGLGRGGL